MKEKNLIVSLNNNIQDDFVIRRNNKGFWIVKEKHKDAKCKQISFKSHGQVFVLTLDVKKSFTTIFKNSEPKFYSKCDAVFFVPVENRLFVFLVELKSQYLADSIHQLKSSKNFVEYILKQLELSQSITIPDVEYRGIVFSLRSAKKQTTKKEKAKYKEQNGLLVTFQPCDLNTSYSLEFFVD